MALSISCLACIWIYVTFHVKSFFLSSMAMLNIFLAIPVSLVTYKLVFGVTYFSYLHVATFLLMIGIGADNIFLLNDSWEHTSKINAIKDDYYKRSAYSFRKASSAIMATSVTNFFAFASNIFANIMPISSFGIFSTISLTYVYLLIIFIMPSYLILYDKHIKNRFVCFSWMKKRI